MIVPTRPPHALSGFCAQRLIFHINELSEFKEMLCWGVAWVQKNCERVQHTLRCLPPPPTGRPRGGSVTIRYGVQVSA